MTRVSWVTTMLLAAALAGCGKGDAGDNTADNAEAAASIAATSGDAPAEAPVAPVAQASKAPINVGDGVLSGPSDFQMAVAFYQVVGLEPPLDEWAKADSRSRAANEFDRPTVAARVQQELLLAARSVAGVGYVELNADSDFGEYDMTSQGFRLKAIDSDRFWTWNHQGATYKLTMENGNEAQLWKLPPDIARTLVETNPYRQVQVKLKVKIVGAIPEGRGGTLQGRIVGYEVLQSNGTKIGGMTFS